MIHFKLFGGFRAEPGNGATMQALGRKAECLICLLALSDGMEVTREKAAGIIWSDRGEDQARASLRQELSQLRRTLGDKVVTATKRSLKLEAAAALYTGALMAGHDPKSEGFEGWVEGERRVLENEALGATIRLAQYHLDAGKADRAIKWAEHAIRIDPLREVSHRLAIEALW